MVLRVLALMLYDRENSMETCGTLMIPLGIKNSHPEMTSWQWPDGNRRSTSSADELRALYEGALWPSEGSTLVPCSPSTQMPRAAQRDRSTRKVWPEIGVFWAVPQQPCNAWQMCLFGQAPCKQPEVDMGQSVGWCGVVCKSAGHRPGRLNSIQIAAQS